MKWVLNFMAPSSGHKKGATRKGGSLVSLAFLSVRPSDQAGSAENDFAATTASRSYRSREAQTEEGDGTGLGTASTSTSTSIEVT